MMVMKPVMSHTAINHPALPTFRTISALTINIPEPIIDPATIMVASIKPRERLKVVSCIKGIFRQDKLFCFQKNKIKKDDNSDRTRADESHCCPKRKPNKTCHRAGQEQAYALKA